MRRRALLILILTMGSVTCTDVYNTPPASPTSPTAPTPTGDEIEYRVQGNVGISLTAIKFTNSVDGTTILPAASLPFVARVTSSERQIFLLLEANATPSTFGATTPILQVQIFVNGRLFREGFAVGFTTLTATASGTWRR